MSSWLTTVSDFAKRHRKKLIGAGVVASVAVVGWRVMTGLRAAQEREYRQLEAKLQRRGRLRKFF